MSGKRGARCFCVSMATVHTPCGVLSEDTNTQSGTIPVFQDQSVWVPAFLWTFDNDFPFTSSLLVLVRESECGRAGEGTQGRSGSGCLFFQIPGQHRLASCA